MRFAITFSYIISFASRMITKCFIFIYNWIICMTMIFKSLKMFGTKSFLKISSITFQNRTFPKWMTMIRWMRNSISQFKIFYPIIRFIMINMMNYFMRIKFSSKMLFHEITMFFRPNFSNFNISITITG